MSDEEVQKQLEQYKFFKQKRQMRLIGEDNLYSRYTNVAAKEKEEAAYLDNLIVDLNQQTKVPPSQGLPSQVTSLTSSKAKQPQAEV